MPHKTHSVCCMCVLSRVLLFTTPWTLAHQAPLSMGFPKQKYWSGLPFSSAGSSNPGIEPTSVALAGGFFTTESPGKPLISLTDLQYNFCHIYFIFIIFIQDHVTAHVHVILSP